jgi:hypothetical protein
MVIGYINLDAKEMYADVYYMHTPYVLQLLIVPLQ